MRFVLDPGKARRKSDLGRICLQMADDTGRQRVYITR